MPHQAASPPRVVGGGPSVVQSSWVGSVAAATMRSGRVLVEGVVDVADGLDESGAFLGGRVECRFPGVDGVLLVGDVLFGSRDGCVREGERVFGGVERGAGGGDGSSCRVG